MTITSRFKRLIPLPAIAFLLIWTVGNALATTLSDNGDGTVTDPTTGLTWPGPVGNSDYRHLTGITGTVTFAGQSDWRMPNIRELTTIVERSWTNPQMWSATADSSDPKNIAWSVGGIADASSY